MTFQLRDYQQQVITEVNQRLVAGKNQMLIQAPTGAGKSLIMAALVKQFVMQGKKVAVIAHRSRLLDQLYGTIEAYCGYKSTYISAGHKTDNSKLVYLCMAQTMSSKKRVLPGVDLILLDEAHVGCSFAGTMRMIDRSMLPVYSLSKTILVGLTATPYRLKKEEGLCRLFNNTIIHTPSPRELMDAGYLTKPIVYTYDSDKIDFKLAKTSAVDDDYTQASLDKILNADYALDVIDKWESVAPESKTFLFAGNVKQAHLFTNEFNKRGYKAELVVGSMSKKATNESYDRFANGEYQVLVGVSKMTEGFDVPSVETVVLARPSKSFALISQMIGRGLRLHNNKGFANILDCSGFLINYNHMQTIKTEEGEKFVDFFNEKATSLCPVKKGSGDMPTKTCQNEECDHELAISAIICSECGTKQDIKIKEKDVYDFPGLIEIEGKDIGMARKQVKSLRKEISRCFSNMQNLTNVEDLYFAAYKEFPQDEWYKGAIFGGEDTEINKSAMSYYLAITCNRNPVQIHKFFNLEFGAETKIVKPMSPTKYLGISSNPEELNRKIIDDAYFKLAGEAKGNGCKILNMCYTEVIRRMNMEL